MGNKEEVFWAMTWIKMLFWAILYICILGIGPTAKWDSIPLELTYLLSGVVSITLLQTWSIVGDIKMAQKEGEE